MGSDLEILAQQINDALLLVRAASHRSLNSETRSGLNAAVEQLLFDADSLIGEVLAANSSDDA